MIHLKTKHRRLEDKQFAILIKPEFIPTPKVSAAENDAELYKACRENGEVIIHEFERDNPFHMKPSYTVLTPEQFESEWIGD